MKFPSMIKGLTFFFFSLGLFFSQVSSQVLAQPKEQNAKEYVIAIEDINYPPHYAFQNGQLIGIIRDILDAFAQDAGYKLKYVPMPIVRGVVSLTSGEVDFKYPDNPVWDGDKKQGHKIIYSTPVVEYVDGFLTKKEKLSMTLDQMKSFSTVLGLVGWDGKVDERIQKGQIRKEETKGLDSSIRQVVNDRSDSVYGDIKAVMYVAKSIQLDDKIEFNKNIPYVKDTYLLSTVKHGEFIEKFNEWQKKNADKVKAMKEKYGLIYTDI